MADTPTRALLIVLDSVGIGGAPDAAAYGDAGADTLGHIAQGCATGAGDRTGLRAGPLHLPNLARLGLGLAMRAAGGKTFRDLMPDGEPAALWGHAVETSRGKDSPSGHWEIAGCPVDFDWGYFPDTQPTFPQWLTDAIISEADLPGILGNRHAPGTAIVEEWGAEHLRTGKPICYTSVDSVLQIAAHEEQFGLARLYEICTLTRRLCDPLKIARVIARPFKGDPQTGFSRTANRKDFAMSPPEGTLFDRLYEAGRAAISVGKVGDIFAHRHTGEEVKPSGDDACLTAAIEALDRLPAGGLIFANLVDFDSDYGHRRDLPGYAAALEAFDRRVPEIEAALRPGDLCILTADHGNDPTWRGTDHTREQVPVIGFGPGIAGGTIGLRESFADIGATVTQWLGIDPPRSGSAFMVRT
ncbi:MAG: phosphopentomutase [Salinarimonas sp.]|nr:phosphopentomutase [Salinarimonas sp.]